MPVVVQPGHADDSVTILLGYGREHCGRVGKGVGYNGYPLRTTSAYNIATDLTLEKTDRRETLVSTQTQDSMEAVARLSKHGGGIPEESEIRRRSGGEP